MPITSTRVPEIDIEHTREDAGLILTIKITAYDHGHLYINDSRGGWAPPGDESKQAAHAIERAVRHINEFFDYHVEPRRRQLPKGKLPGHGRPSGDRDWGL